MEKSASSWIKAIDPYYDFFIKRAFAANRKKSFFNIVTGLTMLIVLMMVSDGTLSRIIRTTTLLMINWLFVNYKAAFIILILVLASSFIFSFLTYQANKRLSEGNPRKREFHPWAIILAPLTWPLFLLGFIALYLVRSLAYLILVIQILFVRIPTRTTILLLDGNDRLRSIIVYLGILFFIIGNFLQLLATF